MGETSGGKQGDTLFTCEYTLTDELLRDFARMQMSGARRGVLLICGLVLVAAGALWLFEPQPLHWAGLAPIALGVYCIWYRSNMWRQVAKREIERMDADKAASGGRWRAIEVDGDGMTVRVRDGREQRYDFSELTNFERDELIYVVIFGKAGVAVPLRSFTRGDADDFGAFLTEKLYPAGSMGPSTPNR